MPSEPAWFENIFESPIPKDENESAILGGRPFVRSGGVLRERALLSAAQRQTEEAFGFKWQKRDTFESSGALARARAWLLERYGDVANSNWLRDYGPDPIVLDAGCGAGMSGMELFGDAFSRIRYVGVDISLAVDVAIARFREKNWPGIFFQADIANLPLKDECVDVIFSEGVLHHTDSTFGALKALTRHLKRGGRFMFYVYKKKGPIREFTDDYIRGRLQKATPQEGWDLTIPLTGLGKVLGELNLEITVPERIDLLDIPEGPINLQRLFYWHVFKAFYHPNYSLEEMNHVNFDWYAPSNAHRHTPEEVRSWCETCNLEIEREVVEEAGITVIARQRN